MQHSEINISTLIHRRRSIFPKFYKPDQPIDRTVIEQLLENANWAPTHRLTEPWRFQVFHSPESRAALGDYMSGYYQHYTPPEAFSEEKMVKAGENPRRAGAVIAIVLHRDPEARIPEFEEIAAVAMAVQNMWLTCTELGLGCYWSTPKAALEASDFLQLAPNEFCLGLFYLGWHDMPEVPGKRGDVGEKVVWR
ncbi:MAG: nitroreductase [Lewinellaceae bacterium]|nr:nitroreductase [Saprospiraceae bacterium]MCB9317436.1 nitroreductase [Lewinellaceae bacterium]MCB9332209.1 nitroreductase [Lewinellaceae bacterium]